MTVLSDYASGTISLTNGEIEFTGTGTSWLLAQFKEGDTIIDITGATEYMGVIATITSNTAGTLTKPWEGPTLTNAAYRIRYLPDGARSTAQAAMLREQLGNGNIQALAGLSGSANKFPMFTGPGAMTLVPKTDLVSGANYNVQVANLAARAAYNGQAEGFAVLVADTGDGRSAIYSKMSNASGDWSAPAYVTGPSISLAVTEVDEVPYGTDPDVTLTPRAGGYDLAFEIPRGMIIEPGTTTTLAPDQPAAVTFVPITGGYRLDIAIPRGPTGDITGVTSFWNTRLGSDANAAAARAGLEAVGGPASSVADRIAVFNGTSGKLIKDGGKTISEIVPGNNSITNAILADVPTGTLKGRASSGTGDPQDLTQAQVLDVLGLSPIAFKVWNVASTSPPAGTPVKLSFGSVFFNEGSYWNSSTFRFAPPAGRYLIGGSLYFTSGVDQASASLQVYKNGALEGYVAYSRMSGSGGPVIIGSSIFIANGTDYFEFYALQNTGGTLAIGNDSSLTYGFGVRLP